MIRTKIPENFRGLVFKNGKLVRVLQPGVYNTFTWGRDTKVDLVSLKGSVLYHAEAKQIAKSGLMDAELRVVELAETERALLWVDRRFCGFLSEEINLIWTVDRDVEIETFDTSEIQFTHKNIEAIRNHESFARHLNRTVVNNGFVGVLKVNQVVTDYLAAGSYAFWKAGADVSISPVCIRETVVNISGQELMTKDRVTLRLNADMGTQVKDVAVYHEATATGNNGLYNRAQLILREEVGKLELDQLLEGKDSLNEVMLERIKSEADSIGVVVTYFGIRDVILPGEMKALMNKVVEARKSAEASNITRREETAAMRSQLNTARLIENNPTLMRIRELETIERIAENGKLSVILGDKGLADKITNLL